MTSRRNLLRARSEHGHSKVTFIELFFDLVFVFAVTQLSDSLIEHFTLLGAVQTLLLMLGMWWVWIYTSWVTNWLELEEAAGAGAAARDDAHRADPVGIDPHRIRIPRPCLRRRLRHHAGRAHAVLPVGGTGTSRHGAQFSANRRMAHARRSILDRWRAPPTILHVWLSGLRRSGWNSSRRPSDFGCLDWAGR